MWSAIRWLVLRIVAARWLFKLSGLALLLPIAMLLKTIGLPLLGVLGVLAFPILILLFVFGLPIFLVLLVGGLLIGMLGIALTMGLVAIKIGLFIVLPVWLVFKLFSTMRRCGRGGGKNNSSKSDSSTGPTTSAPADPIDGVDPA
jgi:hypothetical protein